MNNLREVFQKYAAVVFFDTETTGLDAKTCQIIELAAIRIEQTSRGTLRMAANLDEFIRLPEGEKLPEQITKLTGITDEMLEQQGLDEADVAHDFEALLDDTAGPVLLVAHNAQFDLLFTREMLWKHAGNGEISIHTPTQGVTAKLPNLSAISRSNLLNSNKPAASYAWFVKIIILFP